MDDTQKKSIRLGQLHRLFHDRRQGYTVRELSGRLGVSERTILRDLTDLQMPPYSLPLDKVGWAYQLNRTRAIPLPPVVLTREQAAALYLGARLLMQHSGPLATLAAHAVRRLAEVLPGEVGAYLTQVVPVPAADSGPSAQEQVFADLVAGWVERRKVVCRHVALDGRERHFCLAPYTFEVSATGHAVYTRGQCDEDNDGFLRTLKLDRIHATALTDAVFSHPTADPVETLQTAWRIWGSDAPPVEVRLRFDAAVTARVRETVWHPTQEIADLPDGGCEWRGRVAEPQEMQPWIRSWGATCEVLEPAPLRAALAEEAARLAARYAAGPPPPPGSPNRA